ncbi:kinase-like domain-containing protein [Catenaria anguillulae PL171]|uniref:sphingomyelin phosphodiesterase n=1 Tax=Catenaria anguillulae PL171 TaxID=765915 RepID=A0A1Y2HJG3_9FUNG|nr:kinase-like domain-containing protein [Catenaria anguillulae PL171]
MPLISPTANAPGSSSAPTSPMPNVLNLGHLLTLDDLNAKFEVGDVIGTGAFSEVRKATERATGVQFAVKVIDKSKCRGKETMIQSEVEILKRVKHRNIIRLFEMYESPLKIYLIMEVYVIPTFALHQDGSNAGFYTEADAAKLVCEILLGVQYLHRLNICHRDLKPENLLFYDSSPNSRIMISDFGLSKIFSDEQVMKTACGTPAPEVLRRETYSKQVDMWSIGVITYILLCGYPPFYEENNYALFQQIMSGHYEFDSPYWDNISFEAKNFVARLLIVDPKLRMTVEEALQHQFITKNCADALALARSSSNGHYASTSSVGSASGSHRGSAESLQNRRNGMEQNNLSPTINMNLRSYAQRRSSDKLNATKAVNHENPTVNAVATLPRSNPALRSPSEMSVDVAEPGMSPLRPKTEHREVDDSGLVSSVGDVSCRGTGGRPATAVANHAAAAVNVPVYHQVHTPQLPGGFSYSTAPTSCVTSVSPVGYPAGNYVPSYTQTRTVRFLSYSIFMRVPGVKNLNHSDHKNARLNHFVDQILPNYDVICLQEMYAYGSSRVSRLLQLAKAQGFYWAYTSPSKGLLNGCTDGGLVILSRFEIERHARLAYKRSMHNCRFIAKGALYVKVKLAQDRAVHLFTTNLQKSTTHELSMHSPEVLIRQTQLAQLRSFVAQCTADRSPTEPILLLGDFNLNARSRMGASTDEYKHMMRLLAGDFQHVANPRSLEEFLPAQIDREPLPVRDLLFDAFGYHPVTYGDVICDAHGHPISPAEAILTDKADQGACHSVDYALWVPAKVQDGAVSVAVNKDGRSLCVGIQPFAVADQEFSHVSDHYGVEVVLSVQQ